MKGRCFILAIVAASGQAAGQANLPVEQALLGIWKCEAVSGGMNIKSATTYLAGGKQTFDLAVKGDSDGTTVEFAGVGLADWKFQSDGKLVETVSGITISGGKVNGRDVPSPTLQPVIEQGLVNQTSISTIAIKGRAMTLVDQNNVTSACTR